MGSRSRHNLAVIKHLSNRDKPPVLLICDSEFKRLFELSWDGARYSENQIFYLEGFSNLKGVRPLNSYDNLTVLVRSPSRQSLTQESSTKFLAGLNQMLNFLSHSEKKTRVIVWGSTLAVLSFINDPYIRMKSRELDLCMKYRTKTVVFYLNLPPLDSSNHRLGKWFTDRSEHWQKFTNDLINRSLMSDILHPECLIFHPRGLGGVIAKISMIFRQKLR